MRQHVGGVDPDRVLRRLAPGDTVLLAAFGAGLAWGGTVATWRPSADGGTAPDAGDSGA